MKTRDLLILLGAIIYSFLFYRHATGINVAIFSLFVAIGLTVLNPKALTNKNWWLCIAALFVSTIGIVLYGNTLSYISTLFSWFLLSGCSFKPSQSAILNFTQTIYALPNSVLVLLKERVLKLQRKSTFSGAKANLLPAYIIVVAIVALFITFYAQASTAFRNVLNNIDLSFISFGGILYALLGLIICASFFRHRRSKFLDRKEPRWAATLIAKLPPYPKNFEDQQYSERKSGRLLLLLLNIVIFTVNISDLVFLGGLKIGNTSLNYSEMVHQGIWALVASIVFAIAILLFFFRGQLNFDMKAKGLYWLALVWVAQNLVLVATSGIKNGIYIDIADGLTYKRIGVYYFLALSTIGLLLTAYKVVAKKPNWFLMRTNFAIFFGILVVSSTIHWDSFIAQYNIEKAVADKEDPDIYYLNSLSHQNLPHLIEWAKRVSKNPDTIHQLSNDQIVSLCDRLYIKSKQFERYYSSLQWQSWNLYNQKTYHYLHYVNWNEINTTQPKHR